MTKACRRCGCRVSWGLCRMSSLKIAVVAEGPTDFVFIDSALNAILAGKTFVTTQLQPSGSVAFGDFGGGWGGVYRWCKQNGSNGISELLAERFDAVILHLDADVADANYANSNITPSLSDLPIPCGPNRPPAQLPCSALRKVALSWLGHLPFNQKFAFCIPSMAIEGWLVPILFPKDILSISADPECYPNPASRLAVKGRPKKRAADYRSVGPKITMGWTDLINDGRFVQAIIFNNEVLGLGI